jgi:AcrR family transcriptional regulator
MSPNGCKVEIVEEADTRVRNRRGEGGRLRDDIVDAAAEILGETGSTDAITLRAVARRVGISAPSIYGHFSDREAIVAAVRAWGFTQLILEVQGAASVSEDPVERLHLGCRAYLRFGEKYPQLYQAMFDCGPGAATTGVRGSGGPPADLPEAGAAFAELVKGIAQAAAAGRSASTDPFVDAVATWVALHGLCTLRSSVPEFDWPAEEVVLGLLVERLTRLV